MTRRKAKLTAFGTIGAATLTAAFLMQKPSEAQFGRPGGFGFGGGERNWRSSTGTTRTATAN